VRRLFEAAMNLPTSQQRAFVERFCVDDPITRDEVLGLLDADREMDSARRLLDEGGLKRTSVVEIPERIGPYRAVSVIATGGMGMVYEGIQENPRRRVAIKTLLIGPRDERALTRFEVESDVLARLEHPSIARIYSAGTYSQRIGEEERELPYYVMEYIEGATTLTDYVEKKKLSIRKRLQLFCQVCEAVDFAHGQGVIHRDLKPGNILVDKEGRPKVIDFGTARLSEEEDGKSVGMTRSGEILGTLNYMSPEQLSPTEEPPDARSDVYSLGCVLYELLAGRPAHSAKGRTFPEMMASVVTGALQPPSHWDPSLSRALDLVCMKAMNKKREERYASSEDLSADLKRFMEAREVHAAPPSISGRIRLFTRRQPAFVMALIMIALSVGTGVYLMRRAGLREEELVQRAESAWTESRERGLRDQYVRQNVTTALTSLLKGGVQRSGGGEFLDELEPLTAISNLDEQAVVANQLEVAALTAWELQFFSRSEELFEEALDAWVACRGERDVSTLRVRLALLGVQRDGGSREGLRERLIQLRSDLSVGGEERTQIALGVDYLDACMALDAKRYVDAEALAWELLREQTDYLGAHHPDALKTSWLLGRALMWQGRASAALKYLERTRDGYLSAYGLIHPNTLECQTDLAIALSSPPRCPHASSLLAPVLEKLPLILGEEHSSTLHARVHYDRLLFEDDSTEGLEERLGRSLVICRATLGEEHDLTRICVETLQQLPLRE